MPPEEVRVAEIAVRSRLEGRAPRPRIALVLGSGLTALSRAVQRPVAIPFADIPGFPASRFAGHTGELIAGMLADVPVILQSGRFHLYEGHRPELVALPIRLFRALGARILILTNAAGGLRWGFAPGTLMLIADHLNLTFHNPLHGVVRADEARFPDMSDAYDGRLRSLAREAARAERIVLEEGVYAGLVGPSYETPSEIQMLQRLGADAVGMSTVIEVIAARACGLRCLGFSVITNLAAGRSGSPLTHQEVLETAGGAGTDLSRLVERIVAEVRSGQ